MSGSHVLSEESHEAVNQGIGIGILLNHSKSNVMNSGHLYHMGPEVVSPGVQLLGRKESDFCLVETTSNWSRKCVQRVQVNLDEILVEIEDCVVVAFLLGVCVSLAIADDSASISSKNERLELIDPSQTGRISRDSLVH